MQKDSEQTVSAGAVSSTRLLACWRCDSKPKYRASKRGEWWEVECLCGKRTSQWKTREDATNEWNDDMMLRKEANKQIRPVTTNDLIFAAMEASDTAHQLVGGVVANMPELDLTVCQDLADEARRLSCAATELLNRAKGKPTTKFGK